jgi:hypothetical protein
MSGDQMPAVREAVVAKMYTMDDAPVVRAVRRRIGEVTQDEAALVRTLTPARFKGVTETAHLKELTDLIFTVRAEEAMGDYVYAIAPTWDGTIESLLLAGRVTAALMRLELSRVA